MTARLATFAVACGLASGPAAWAGCELHAVASLPIKEIGGRMFVPGQIGDQRVDFMIDPATHTTLLQAAARRFGISPDNMHELDRPAILGDEAGETVLPGTDQPVPTRLAVEHLMLHVGGSVADLGGPDAVVVLGLDMLAGYDVEFDPARKTMTLFQNKGCQGAWLGYWDKNAARAEMLANIEHHPNVEFYNSYNYPNVTLRMSVDGREFKAALDPALAETELSFTAAHDLGAQREGDPIGYERDLVRGHEEPLWSHQFAKAQLGGEAIPTPTFKLRGFKGGAGAAVRRGSSEDMALGADFFLSHRVLISYSQHKVYFTYAGTRLFLGATPETPAAISAR